VIYARSVSLLAVVIGV